METETLFPRLASALKRKRRYRFDRTHLADNGNIMVQRQNKSTSMSIADMSFLRNRTFFDQILKISTKYFFNKSENSMDHVWTTDKLGNVVLSKRGPCFI